MAKLQQKSIRLPKSSGTVYSSIKKDKSHEKSLYLSNPKRKGLLKRFGVKQYVYVKYNNLLNEVRFSIKNNIKPEAPTKKKGEVEQTHLDRRASKRIKDACKLITEGKSTLITLTYGKIYPDDKTAKKHLDNLLKNIRYYLGENLNYTWILEKQERGAPHFHIVCRQYVCGEKIQKWWLRQYNKWLSSQGEEEVPFVITRAEKVKNGKCSKYITKNGIRYKSVGRYLTKSTNPECNHGHSVSGKMYGIDEMTSKMIRYDRVIIEAPSEEEANDFVDMVMCEAFNEKTPHYTWQDKRMNTCGVIYDRQIVKYVKLLVTEQQIKDLRIYYQSLPKIDFRKPLNKTEQELLRVA